MTDIERDARPLRVLLLEDDPRDAEIVLDTLGQGGFACAAERVDTQDAFLRALEGSSPFDVILADYVLPGFDAVEALAITRRRRPDLPFILISGRVGEEAAIDMLHAGATDYVLKQRLGRLLPAVKRALREKVLEAERQVAVRHLADVASRLEEKALLERVIAEVPVGILVAQAPGGEILALNQRIENLLGRPRSELKKEADIARCGVYRADGHRAQLEDLPSHATLTKGVPVRDALLEFRNRDGKSVLALVNTDAIRDPAGDMLAVVASYSDVTELRRAQTAVVRLAEDLRDREQRLRGMFERAALGIVEAGPDERLLAVNDRFGEILRYPPDDLLGKSVRELTVPEDRAISDQLIADLREGRRDCYDCEKRYLRSDGTTVWVHITVSCLRDAARSYRGTIGTVEDISKRKAAEAERDRLIETLREADRRKNEFLGMLSHELRNPLAPIRNSLYILGRTPPGGAQATRALAVIDRQVQHTTRLVDDLLDVTRISRGKVRLQRERVDLVDLARGAVEDHRDLFEKSGVRLDLRLPEDPIVVNADPTRILQMIGNLLQNAVKFTSRGGETTLALDQSDGFAAVIVQDTGSGISPEVLARLFEPFVQAESTLDRSTGGLGLGLALVKGLAELHGGTVRADSGGIGKGTTVTVCLPLERRKTPRLSVVPPRPEPGAARRVLVIEDNIDAAETLKEALELNDHVVEIALTGWDGLDKLHSMHPDIVLCDIGLAGIDGFEVAKRIRADPENGGVALIALSGYAQPEDIERSKQVGFDLHLAKPPIVETLERAMAQARESAEARSTASKTKSGSGDS